MLLLGGDTKELIELCTEEPPPVLLMPALTHYLLGQKLSMHTASIATVQFESTDKTE